MCKSLAVLLLFTAGISPLAEAASLQPAVSPGATEQADTPPKGAVTKIEAFTARTGVVVIKGFTKLGGLQSSLGRIIINAREIRDASNPKQVTYGITVDVKEGGRSERENTAYIDEDEIDSLIKGIDYISKIDKSVSTLFNFEAQYSTKGDFSVTVFSEPGNSGSLSVAISAGRIGKTTAFIKLSEMEDIRSLLVEAKNVIVKAKASAK